MMSKKFKKATLSISIGAIVVIVIAFVVLGLGLTLTQTIFKGAQEKIPGILKIGDIGTEPTSETPLTIDDTIIIKRNKDKELKVGLYNKDINPEVNASIHFKICIPVGALEYDEGKKPTITSIKQTVEPSEGKGYQIFVQENGLTAGNYLCVVAVASDTKEFETKQISLKVTS